MSAENTIRELAAAYLADSHNADGVRFIDRLLLVAAEAGKITCRLASEDVLQLQVGDLPPWNLALPRARGKLRILCARLGVLCKDSGDQGISLYGGEGTIKWDALFSVFPADAPVIVNGAPGQLAGAHGRPRPTTDSWFVCFRNTPAEQGFTISAQ